QRTHGAGVEAHTLEMTARWRLESQAIALGDRRAHLDDDLVAFHPDHTAEFEAAIVGLRARDVAPSFAAAVHPAREAPREDLHERLHFLEARLREGAALHALQELAVALRHRRDELRLLLAAFDLEA